MVCISRLEHGCWFNSQFPCELIIHNAHLTQMFRHNVEERIQVQSINSNQNTKTEITAVYENVFFEGIYLQYMYKNSMTE